MLIAAIHYIDRCLGSDGLWRDFLTLAGESTDWVTGYVGAALLTAAGRTSAVDRAAAALAERQHSDGGWGYHHGVPSDADSTAYALLLLLKVRPPDESTINAGLRCLLFHQQLDGGIATYREAAPIRAYMDLPDDISLDGWIQPHLAVTAAAGRAFAAAGGGWLAPAVKAWEYVAANQEREGSWRSYWWALPYYPTFQAIALGAALRQHANVAAVLDRARDWLTGTQQEDGAWAFQPGSAAPSAFATSLALASLATIDRVGSARAIHRGLDALRRLQADDGSWPTQPAMIIPPPHLIEPRDKTRWRRDGLGTGVMIRDQKRLYTTATALTALALARAE